MWTDILGTSSHPSDSTHVKPGGPFFFDRFKFFLTYRPGSSNINPNAMSCLPGEEEVCKTPNSIIFPSYLGAAIMLEVEKETEATHPLAQLFVPDAVVSCVALGSSF